jgi:uncharacterized membrane protein YgaE (UPF0421/DUF939 family)
MDFFAKMLKSFAKRKMEKKKDTHITLEQLLDRYNSKKEKKITNEELNRKNKGVIRRVVDLIKKAIPILKRRKLSNK